MNCYLARQQYDARNALVERLKKSHNRVLRSTGLQREATVCSDRGDIRDAWRAFNEARHLTPDDPSLSHLEVLLLLAEGRDIGTVVCPDAPVKLYVTASPEVRARRRYDEIIAKGATADFDAIFADVKTRDERDMGRADSPLKPAEDAHLLDTSEMSIEAAFLAAKTLIDAALTK